MAKILRCDCARARARTLHNIRARVLWSESRHSKNTHTNNAKGLGFRTFDSISILCANFCTRKKNTKQNHKKRTRAHKMRFILYACMHTCVCGGRCTIREEWIRQTSFRADDGVLYISVYYVRIYCTRRIEWERERSRKRENDSIESTDKQLRIVTIILAALYELYDTNMHTKTLIDTHIHAHKPYKLYIFSANKRKLNTRLRSVKFVQWMSLDFSSENVFVCVYDARHVCVWFMLIFCILCRL